MSSATVGPVTTFADEPTAWLEYLAQRTRSTVGRRADAADLVVVGTVSGDSMSVTEALKGRAGAVRLRTGEAAATGTGGLVPNPAPPDGSAVVAFLTVESGDGDGDGGGPVATCRPIGWPGAFEGDGPAADAVRWFQALPASGAERAEALRAGLGDPNPSVWRAAVRALADEGDRRSQGTLLELARDADPDRATRAAVALWELGAHGEASSALAEAREAAGDAFLAMWGVRRTQGAGGLGVLYGPDPAYEAGD